MAYKNDSGFPSPSDILDPWIDKKWFKPEHSERGVNVHSAITATLKGVVPIWKEGLDGYRESFLQIRDYIESVVMAETRLVDKTLCYSGQMDLVAKLSKKACAALLLPYPTTALCDWKTSAQSAIDWPLRMAAYYNLCIVNGIKLDVHILFRIRKDGSSPKIKVSLPDETRFFFPYFKAALLSWYYFKVGVTFKKSS